MSEDASPLLFSISAAPTINSFGASKIRGSPLLANASDSTINFYRSATGGTMTATGGMTTGGTTMVRGSKATGGTMTATGGTMMMLHVEYD